VVHFFLNFFFVFLFFFSFFQSYSKGPYFVLKKRFVLPKGEVRMSVEEECDFDASVQIPYALCTTNRRVVVWSFSFPERERERGVRTPHCIRILLQKSFIKDFFKRRRVWERNTTPLFYYYLHKKSRLLLRFFFARCGLSIILKSTLTRKETDNRRAGKRERRARSEKKKVCFLGSRTRAGTILSRVHYWRCTTVFIIKHFILFFAKRPLTWCCNAPVRGTRKKKKKKKKNFSSSSLFGNDGARRAGGRVGGEEQIGSEFGNHIV
jgi:hypothetical protein